MKKSLLGILVGLSFVSLQGCVTVTTGIEADEAVGYEEGVPVSSEHALYQGVTVGDVEGFSGTSIFIMTGDVSPDMSNDGVLEALKATLDNAKMLAPDNDGHYELSAQFVDNNEEGVWGGGLFIVDMNRKTTIDYQLKERGTGQLLLDKSVYSEGGDVHIRGFSAKGLYFKEKETAVPSYKNNFTQLVEELKRIGK